MAEIESSATERALEEMGERSTILSGQDAMDAMVNAIGEQITLSQEELPAGEITLSADEERLLQQVLEDAHQEIPVNSATIEEDDSTSRFSGAVWYSAIQDKVITLAGLGGIGSYVGFLLSRMHPKHIYMYDDDIVEEANMSGQLYSSLDVNENKVNALGGMMGNYSGYHTTTEFNDKFGEYSRATDIMICGFDNMEARKTFFKAWKEHVGMITTDEGRKKCLFIDGRLAAEEFQILCITGDNAEAMIRYERDFLFSDAQADATICSYKQTTFCANMIASYMVNSFVNFVANSCNPLMPRSVPFYTYYNAETMYLKIEE